MATTQEEKTRVSIEEDIQDIKDNQHEAATSNAFVEDTPEEKKLLWKIDLWLMPTIWVLYLFSYMVRTTAQYQIPTNQTGPHKHRQCQSSRHGGIFETHG